MAIFYTSDLHLGDGGKTIEKCNRPFASLEEYEAALKIKWNSKVSNDDKVYILGDLCCSKQFEIEKFIRDLNGTKYLVEGNHDHHWLTEKNTMLFEETCKMKIMVDEDRFVHLCHYPLWDWYKKDYGSYHIFGHIHNSDIPRETSKLIMNSFNCGVDVNDFEPVTLDEMIIKNNRL